VPVMEPAALREELRLTVKIYDDGSALIACEAGPCATVTDFRQAWLCEAPTGLMAASEVACGLIGIWADAGVLGLASEAAL
jgi:hypothetical protein